MSFSQTRLRGATQSTYADDQSEQQTVAALDAEYQQAVKENDAATMDRLLADDFVLVTSSGKTYSKFELLEEAKSGRITYEHQEDTDKTVRLCGDTAVVTAKLWEKGTENGRPFDKKLWFSDVYRRTPKGWRYVFAQSAYGFGGILLVETAAKQTSSFRAGKRARVLLSTLPDAPDSPDQRISCHSDRHKHHERK